MSRGNTVLLPSLDERPLPISAPKPMDGLDTLASMCFSSPTKAPQKTKRMFLVSMVYWSVFPVGGGTGGAMPEVPGP